MGKFILYNAIIGNSGYATGYSYPSGYAQPPPRPVYVEQAQPTSGWIGFWTFMIIIMFIVLIVGFSYYICQIRISEREKREAMQRRARGASDEFEDRHVASSAKVERPEPSAVHSPTSIERLRKGDIVHLRDAQSMRDAEKLGTGSRGLRCEVTSTAQVRESHDLATWTFVRLQAPKQELLLMVKRVDQDETVYCFYPDQVEAGTRNEIIDRGDKWVYQPPENPADFNPMRLSYTGDMVRHWGDGKDDTYLQKAQRELHGEWVEAPARSGVGVLTATVVEYRCDNPEQENPEWLVLEVGSKNSSRVEFWMGAPIERQEAVLSAGHPPDAF
jgi:hypothetical protein